MKITVKKVLLAVLYVVGAGLICTGVGMQEGVSTALIGGGVAVLIPFVVVAFVAFLDA